MGYGNYPDLKDIKKILVVKLRHLGDVLLTSCVFSTLRRYFPKAEIHGYVYKEAFDILEGHNAVDKILVYDREYKKKSFLKKLQYEISFLRKIRKEKYDLVINLTEGDRGAIVAGISHAKVKVGMDSRKSGMYGKEKLYTHIVKGCLTPRHCVEKNLDALRKIHLFPEGEDLHLQFHISKDIHEKTENFLKSKNFQEKDFILFHPFSRWKFKCWPTYKFLSLAKELVKEKQKIVLTGGKEESEKKMASEIAKEFSSQDLLNLCGKTSLKELGSLISKAKALVCVDSIALHIASALKAKTVVLFGPTSEINWGPWQNPFAKVISSLMSCRPCYMDGCGGSKISDCLLQISTDVVKQNLQDFL